MKWVLALLFLFSCSNISKVGLKNHTFGQRPAKIVWLQVAGLTSEHLSLLRFSYPQASTLTSFELSTCFGNSWTFNMYNLRPNASDSFLGQISGKKNIEGTCADFKHRPIWSYLERNAYQTGIFETQASARDSIFRYQSCKESADYLKGVTTWRMDPNATKDSQKFHFSETSDFKPGEKYFDRSCSEGKCYASLGFNIKSIFKRFEKNKKRYLFILRDFEYQKALKKRDLGMMRERLIELNSIHNYFYKYGENRKDFLLLVTSGAPAKIQLPTLGKEWTELQKKNKRVGLFKNASLLAPVFAHGARSENFCGVYEEVDIFKRIFIGPRFRGLYLNFLEKDN